MQYQGNPVSPGLAIGAVYRFIPYTPLVEQREIAQGEARAELDRYYRARAAAQEELETLCRRFSASDQEKTAIFAAHLDILMDVAMEEDICAAVEDELLGAEWAVQKVYGRYAEQIAGVADPLMRERSSDLKDVSRRILRCLEGAEDHDLSSLEHAAIVVAHDLLPSQTALLDRDRVLGIAAEIGGSTSHSAIIARSYGIPAVLGIEGILDAVQDGETVILDALKGTLSTRPTHDELATAERRKSEYAVRAAELRRWRDVPCVMADGTQVGIHLNIGSATPDELSASVYTDGVGLFRSEFLYMSRPQLPGEEEQLEAYRRALEAFAPRPVVLRTMDIGGDKKLECMDLPREENPFLGSRALRLCFRRKDIFRTQLRAAYRASVYGKLWIMFPMVSSVDDIRRAKQIAEEVRQELEGEGIPFDREVKLGIMIETPAMAVLADRAAKEVDFASIGTNDLCQYALAVDRLNPEVAEYYQSYHPALFRLIGIAGSAFREAGKPLGVCGELGGDPLAAPVLVGLGVTKLSMSASAVAGVKKMLCGLTMEEARHIAQQAANRSTAKEVHRFLEQKLGEVLNR